MADHETAARARTRSAILDAAIDVLGVDAGASLSDIAAAARVSRTTVHRYFAERADLLAGVTDEMLRRITRAAERARFDQGPAPAALERGLREYFELDRELGVMFTGAIEIADEDWGRYEIAPERGVGAAVARGQADGTIDPTLPAEWVENHLWALLYTSWSYGRENDVPRQTTLDLCVVSLRKVLAPG